MQEWSTVKIAEAFPVLDIEPTTEYKEKCARLVDPGTAFSSRKTDLFQLSELLHEFICLFPHVFVCSRGQSSRQSSRADACVPRGTGTEETRSRGWYDYIDDSSHSSCTSTRRCDWAHTHAIHPLLHLRFDLSLARQSFKIQLNLMQLHPTEFALRYRNPHPEGIPMPM